MHAYFTVLAPCAPTPISLCHQHVRSRLVSSAGARPGVPTPAPETLFPLMPVNRSTATVGPLVVQQALSISGGRIKEPRLLPTEMSGDGKLCVRLHQRDSWLQQFVYGQNVQRGKISSWWTRS